MLTAYEEGFNGGVLDEVVKAASAAAGMQECRDCGQEFPYAPDADYCPSCVEEADIRGNR